MAECFDQLFANGSLSRGSRRVCSSTMSFTSRRGVRGRVPALVGAHPTGTTNCGTAVPLSTSSRMMRQVCAISIGWDSGQVARPSSVAPSRAALVASPARSRDRASSLEGGDHDVLGLLAVAFAGWLGECAVRERPQAGCPVVVAGRGRDAGGEHAVAAAGPECQFRGVVGIVLLHDRGLGDRAGQVEPGGGVGDRDVERAFVLCECGDAGEVVRRHRPGGHPSAVGASSGDRGGQRDITVGRVVGLNSTAARWCGWPGFGMRCTVVCHPRAASAVRRWCSAAPQLITRSRPSGSTAGSWRVQSACRWIESSPSDHRHGWVLWTEGAREARATAARRGSWSGPWVFMPSSPCPTRCYRLHCPPPH
jgi:hypothetical protein